VSEEIQLYFGRDVLEILEAMLHPDTILVIGSENHAWGSGNRKLMKRLLKHGHSVVLAEQQKTSWHPFLGKERSDSCRMIQLRRELSAVVAFALTHHSRRRVDVYSRYFPRALLRTPRRVTLSFQLLKTLAADIFTRRAANFALGKG
jgi:hypothetical protein